MKGLSMNKMLGSIKRRPTAGKPDRLGHRQVLRPPTAKLSTNPLPGNSNRAFG